MYAAHPKVIAYMMQGGLQSLQEAVHYAVPVVAIPFFGDQYFNARKILDASIGLTLDIDTITENSVVRTLTEIVENKTWVWPGFNTESRRWPMIFRKINPDGISLFLNRTHL